jgi:hypothetical protein
MMTYLKLGHRSWSRALLVSEAGMLLLCMRKRFYVVTRDLHREFPVNMRDGRGPALLS